MDPISNLYTRLMANADSQSTHARWPEPPQLEEWLQYWNDDDTDLGNLRNYEHWLSRARTAARRTRSSNRD